MREDDLKLIASVGNWSDVNKLMMLVYYEHFGKLLEQKLDTVQQCKLSIKECIKQAYGSSKVPVTPKRLNPTKKLLDQIHHIKKLCFESDDEEGEKQSVKSYSLSTGIVLEQSAEGNHIGSLIPKEAENVPLEISKTEKSALSANKNNVAKTKTSQDNKSKTIVKAPGSNTNEVRLAAEVFKTPIIKGKGAKKKTPVQTAISIKSQVVRQSARLRKIKEMQDKTEQAKKQREELLKEKSERVKRELEERRIRVEHNNRRLEKDKRVREGALRAKTNSPFAGSTSKFDMPRFVPMPFFHSSPPPMSKNIREIIDSSSESCEAVPETPSPAIRRCVTFSSNKTSLNKTEEVINDSLASSRIAEQTVVEDGLNESNVLSLPPSAFRQPNKILPKALTNYSVDDLSSNDATDDDENPRKVIPLWARPDALRKHVPSVNRLLDHLQKERHFGQIIKPELRMIFPNYVPKKQPTRKSKVSAMWESPLTDPRVGQSRFQQFSQQYQKTGGKKN